MNLYHKFTYLSLNLFARWLRLLNDQTRDRLAIRLAAFIYNWVPLRKSTAVKNIARAFPDKSADWHEGVLRRCYQFFLRLACLFFVIPEKYPQLKIHVTGREALDAALTGNQGAIMVAGHFGAWEVYAAWTGYNNYPVVPVAVRQRNRGANRFFTELRGQAGITPIYRKESLDNMYAALEAGKLLTLGSDQDARKHGVFVEFFGQYSSTPKGTALFHLNTGAPVVCGACYEESDEYYLELERLPITPEDDVQSITQKYTTLLEQAVRRHPEQYFWWHRRWKTRPPATE